MQWYCVCACLCVCTMKRDPCWVFFIEQLYLLLKSRSGTMMHEPSRNSFLAVVIPKKREKKKKLMTDLAACCHPLYLTRLPVKPNLFNQTKKKKLETNSTDQKQASYFWRQNEREVDGWAAIGRSILLFCPSVKNSIAEHGNCHQRANSVHHLRCHRAHHAASLQNQSWKHLKMNESFPQNLLLHRIYLYF